MDVMFSSYTWGMNGKWNMGCWTLSPKLVLKREQGRGPIISLSFLNYGGYGKPCMIQVTGSIVRSCRIFLHQQ